MYFAREIDSDPAIEKFVQSDPPVSRPPVSRSPLFRGFWGPKISSRSLSVVLIFHPFYVILKHF